MSRRLYWSNGAALFAQLAHGQWTQFSFAGMTPTAKDYIGELVKRDLLEIRPVGPFGTLQGIRAEMRLTDKGMQRWDRVVTRLLLVTAKKTPLRRV